MRQGSLAEIRGVGEASLEKLHQAGIFSQLDLIYFLPREYRVVNFCRQIADIQPGQVTIRAKAAKISHRRGQKRFLEITTAELEDSSGKILATWFNQPYRQKQLASGEFYFSGEYSFQRGQFQLLNPSVQTVTSASIQRLARDFIEPIYSSVRGLKTSFLAKAISKLNGEIMLLDEILPTIIIQKLGLLSRSDALYQLHFPTSLEQVKQAKWRYLIEKYLIANLATLIAKEIGQTRTATCIKPDYDLVKQFVNSLPFQLTDDQRKASFRILENLNHTSALNCLLQGDVGSGKTIAALIVALVVIKQGGQVAFMAPTEILASQHFKTAQKLLQTFDVRTEILTSSLKKSAKQQLYQDLQAGKIDLIIGTHALIQPEVEFANLQLVVIDEQHRFGVMQRQALAQKSLSQPHLLSMTATPIPRSLALVLKNELMIVSIRQKPASRLPIKTQLMSQPQVAYQAIRNQLAEGRQGYIVCSLIDHSTDLDRQSVEKTYQTLAKGEFKDYRLATLHGKMKSDEKEQIMRDFLAGMYDLLITTTVVEVGVDVPNATVMLIQDAENYGLSQLHQLRGRIGRGLAQSYCYLLSNASADANQRLQEIVKSQDGFYLAEVDLKLRGMGDLFGQSQHGWFDLDANLEAIEAAATGCELYQQDLVQRQVTAQADLQNYPELWSQIEQFDRLTILN